MTKQTTLSFAETTQQAAAAESATIKRASKKAKKVEAAETQAAETQAETQAAETVVAETQGLLERINAPSYAYDFCVSDETRKQIEAEMLMFEKMELIENVYDEKCSRQTRLENLARLTKICGGLEAAQCEVQAYKSIFARDEELRTWYEHDGLEFREKFMESKALERVIAMELMQKVNSDVSTLPKCGIGLAINIRIAEMALKGERYMYTKKIFDLCDQLSLIEEKNASGSFRAYQSAGSIGKQGRSTEFRDTLGVICGDDLRCVGFVAHAGLALKKSVSEYIRRSNAVKNLIINSVMIYDNILGFEVDDDESGLVKAFDKQPEEIRDRMLHLCYAGQLDIDYIRQGLELAREKKHKEIVTKDLVTTKKARVSRATQIKESIITDEIAALDLSDFLGL